MLEALFAAAAEAVFSYILDTLEPAERLRDWLKRSPVKLAYQHALARTYAAFARQYPELTASLFNESFLTIEAAPELAKFLTRHQHPDHTQLVRLWAKSITPQTEAGQPSVEALSICEDLNLASAYFVELLTAELKHESALQPLFDSRSLESLPAIEAKLDQLTNALKQAMTVANKYEQTVINRSGGVDFQAQEVTIGGDVVGRDKIVDNSIKVGDISNVQAVAIGHGAHASVTTNYFTGDFVTLDDLYIHPDAVFQRVHVQDFVGREWLTVKVDAFLNDEKRKSGVFLLVGEAGVGKTSFMAHLVSERRYLHLFAEQVPGDVNVSRALQSLGAQLVARYQIDPYKEKGTLPAIATFPDFLDKLLHLAADRLSVGEKIVIVCDALDEAGTAPNGSVFGLPSVLPDGVYFILSQRPVTVKLSVKSDLVKETIDAAGADNLHDVEQYLTAVSRRPGVSHQLRAHNYTETDFVRILKERSGGVWMYLFYVVSEIAAGSRAPLDLATLPSGLVGYYTDYWGDWCEGRNGRGDGPTKWDAIYAPLLAALAAAQLPITLKLLLAWSHVQAAEYVVERLLRRNWRAFITERDIDHTPHFALYHASLRDFLTGQVDRQRLTLEAEQLIDELAHRTRSAHARIVEYYRQQCNGDWAKLVDDDYARTHLCLHLSASGDNETMFQLVAMSNVWAETKYGKEESYAGYLIDLNRAWQYVETETNRNIGRQIRCALIESSIHSLAGNITPELLCLLVQTGIWNPARALSYVPQIPDESNRANTVRSLAILLPDELKTEALSAARAIINEDYRARALTGLSPYLSEDLLAEALSASRAIIDEYSRVQSLTGLVPHLSDALKAEALSIACVIVDEDARAKALTGLVPHLPDALKAEALNVARAIIDEETRAKGLTGLAPHLPDDLKARAVQEALSATCAITHGFFRARTLTGVAPQLSTEAMKAEALRAARAIIDKRWRVRALIGLAPYLFDALKAEVVQEALSTARTIADVNSRAEALPHLVQHLPDALKAEVVQEALSIAPAITNVNSRAQALIDLAAHLPDALKANAFSVAYTITDVNLRIEALTALAPHLPDVLKAEALSIARTIFIEDSRAKALTSLTPHLPDALKAEALSIACAIVDEDARAEALTGLAPYLPDALKAEALNVVRAIIDENSRAHALSGLAPHLPDALKAEVVSEALSAARAITDDYKRTRTLTDIAPSMAGALKAAVVKEALSAACTIADEYRQAEALTRLAPYLSDALKAEVVKDAFSKVRTVTYEGLRPQVLTDLASYLPDALKTEALSIARAIIDEYSRAQALTGLAPYLFDALKAEAVKESLSATRAITDEVWRARALSELVPHSPDAFKAEIVQETLNIVRTITHEGLRSGVLSDLAPNFPDALKTEALNVARAITDNYSRALALNDLAPHLPNALKAEAVQEALRAVRTITNEDSRTKALTSLAPHLPDALKAEALSIARTITDEDRRVQALTSLVPYLFDALKAEVVQEALSTAATITDEDWRALALTGLVQHLPDASKVEVIEAIQKSISTPRDVFSEFSTVRGRVGLAPNLPDKLQIQIVRESFLIAKSDEIKQIISIWSNHDFAGFPMPLWINKLHALARITRQGLLYDLIALLPLIEHLGGQSAIKELCYALRDVTTWWS